HMIRIIALFILFTVSPILSANINPIGAVKNGDELKPLTSKIEALSKEILNKLQSVAQVTKKEVIKLAISGYLNVLDEGKISSGSPLSKIGRASCRERQQTSVDT